MLLKLCPSPCSSAGLASNVDPPVLAGLASLMYSLMSTHLMNMTAHKWLASNFSVDNFLFRLACTSPQSMKQLPSGLRGYGRIFLLPAAAQHWETLVKLSSVWFPSSAISSQDLSQPTTPVPLSAYPAASYAGAVAASLITSNLPAPAHLGGVFHTWMLGFLLEFPLSFFIFCSNLHPLEQC
jgi:hypothetical protein